MNPLIPLPNVLDRWSGYLTLQFRNDPDILGYRIRVSNSLNNAYGTANGVTGVGTIALFDLVRDQSYVSRGLRQRRVAITGDTTRGQTRATYDPNEFVGVAATVPPDVQFAFMRTQVRTAAAPTFPVTADNTNQSEILIVQNPGFFGVAQPSLTVAGTAPTIGTAAVGLPAPPEAMVFHFPGFGEAMVITNHSTSEPLLYATGRNQPLAQIDPEVAIMHQGGMKDELVFCGASAVVEFSLLISVANGR